MVRALTRAGGGGAAGRDADRSAAASTCRAIAARAGLAPENTLAAFERALALGVTTLETDVAITRDGVPVISHDPFLNPDLVRGPDGAWLAASGPAIRTLTAEELARYDIGRLNPASDIREAVSRSRRRADGERFPTLAQVLALGQGNEVRFNVETKITPDGADTADPATFARLVVAAVREAGMTARVTVQSFDWRTLVAVKRLAPEIATACLTIESPGIDTVQRHQAGPRPGTPASTARRFGGSVPRTARAAGCGTWSPFWRNVTPARGGGGPRGRAARRCRGP